MKPTFNNHNKNKRFHLTDLLKTENIQMKRILININIVVLVSFSSLANAQTLQELINIALANNYQI